MLVVPLVVQPLKVPVSKPPLVMGLLGEGVGLGDGEGTPLATVNVALADAVVPSL
jgi:hypothetical protein